jgi:hypothetical protein
LQDNHDKKKYKNDTSINQRKDKNRECLKQVFQFKSIGKNQDKIKGSLDYVIPISVSVRMNDAIIHEQSNKNQSIESDNSKSKLCKNIQRPSCSHCRSTISTVVDDNVRGKRVTLVNKTAFVDIPISNDILCGDKKLLTSIFTHTNNNNNQRNQRGRFVKKSKSKTTTKTKTKSTVVVNDNDDDDDDDVDLLNNEEKKIIQYSPRPIIIEKCIFQDCTQKHIVIKGNSSYRNQYISKHNTAMHSDCTVKTSKNPNSKLNKLEISKDKLCSYCGKTFYTQLSKKEHEETRCIHNPNKFNKLEWQVSLQKPQEKQTLRTRKNKHFNDSVVLRLQATKTSLYF